MPNSKAADQASTTATTTPADALSVLDDLLLRARFSIVSDEKNAFTLQRPMYLPDAEPGGPTVREALAALVHEVWTNSVEVDTLRRRVASFDDWTDDAGKTWSAPSARMYAQEVKVRQQHEERAAQASARADAAEARLLELEPEPVGDATFEQYWADRTAAAGAKPARGDKAAAIALWGEMKARLPHAPGHDGGPA